MIYGIYTRIVFCTTVTGGQTTLATTTKLLLLEGSNGSPAMLPYSWGCVKPESSSA
jgi:hypothetical protein